jgi:hypothetical protein
MVDFSKRDKTTGLTAGATEILLKELHNRQKIGFSATKTSLASEAIIAYFGKHNAPGGREGV